jgi:Mor family transcriptional regulator
VPDAIVELLEDEEIHNICRDIASGLFTMTELARKYKRSYRTIYGIKTMERHTDISSQYDFSNYRNIKKRTTPEVVHAICKDLENGVNRVVIASTYKVSDTTVKNIFNRKVHTKISKDYKF